MQPRALLRRLTSIAVPDGWPAARGVGVTVAVLVGLQVLLGLLVGTSVTAGLDADLWTWFDRFNRPGGAQLIVQALLLCGQFVLVWATVLVVSGLVSLRLHSWRPFLAAGGTMILLDGLVLPYKYVLGRSFPHTGQNTVFGSGESFLAYPSGHAAHATIAMLLLAAMVSRLWPPAEGDGWWGLRVGPAVVAGVLAIGAGLANIVLGYHWFTDVVGGWIIGLTAFVIAHWLQRQGSGTDRPGRVPRRGMIRRTTGGRA